MAILKVKVRAACGSETNKISAIQINIISLYGLPSVPLYGSHLWMGFLFLLLF